MADTQLYLILFTALNIFLSSNAGYIRRPPKNNDLKAALKQSFELKCEYTGDDGEFLEWYKDDIPVSSEKPGRYTVKTTKKESKLIINSFDKADAEVRKWLVKTNKKTFREPVECRFGSIKLISSPQSMATNQPNEKLGSTHGSVRRNQNESVSFKCIIEPSQDQSNQLEWKFSKNDDKFSELPDGVTVTNDGQLLIGRVKKTHRGYYRCSLNDVSFTVLLRVKDRLAVLWPFIGIVSFVLVLVIVILIFEKRQKSTKKAAVTDDDEIDQANDPLVRTSNISSDNEEKKHAVKA